MGNAMSEQVAGIAAEFERVVIKPGSQPKSVGDPIAALVSFNYKGIELKVNLYWMIAPGNTQIAGDYNEQFAQQVASQELTLNYESSPAPYPSPSGYYHLSGTFPDLLPKYSLIEWMNSFDCFIGIVRLDTGELIKGGTRWFDDKYYRVDWREPIEVEVTGLDASFS